MFADSCEPGLTVVISKSSCCRTLWVRGASAAASQPNGWAETARAPRPHTQTSVAGKGARQDRMPRVTATTATLQISRQGHTINAGVVKFLRTLSPCKGS